ACASGYSSRVISLMRVDLPQPFGPSRAVCWPCAMDRHNPCNTFTWPRMTVAWSSSISAAVDDGASWAGTMVMIAVMVCGNNKRKASAAPYDNPVWRGYPAAAVAMAAAAADGVVAAAGAGTGGQRYRQL